MGLLSGLTNAVKSATKVVTTAVAHPVKSFLAGTTAVTAAFTQPITTAKNVFTEGFGKGLATSIEQTSQRSLSSNIGRVLGTTAAVGAVVVGGGAALGSSTARTIGSSAVSALSTAAKVVTPVIKKHPYASTAVILSTPNVVNLLAGSEKARGTAGGVVSSVVTGSLGTDVAKTLEGEKPLLETIKEHPVATGAAALGAGLIVGKGLTTAGAIAAGGLLDDDDSIKINQPGQELSPKAAILPTSTALLEDTGELAKVTTQPSGVPVLSTDKQTKRRYKAKKPVQPVRISNRVDIRNLNKVSISSKKVKRWH